MRHAAGHEHAMDARVRSRDLAQQLEPLERPDRQIDDGDVEANVRVVDLGGRLPERPRARDVVAEIGELALQCLADGFRIVDDEYVAGRALAPARAWMCAA